MSIRIISEDPEIRKIFNVERPEPLNQLNISLEDVIRHMERKIEYDYLWDIVHGVFGADPLDYLVRDAVNSGTVEYGKIDVKRIIDNLVVIERDGRKCILSFKLAKNESEQEWLSLYRRGLKGLNLKLVSLITQGLKNAVKFCISLHSYSIMHDL